MPHRGSRHARAVWLYNVRRSRAKTMKYLAIAATTTLVLLVFGARAGDKKVDVSKVHGRIQYVKSFPDYKVQAVNSSSGSARGIVKELSVFLGEMADRRFLPRLQNRDGRFVSGFHGGICEQLPRPGEVDLLAGSE